MARKKRGASSSSGLQPNPLINKYHRSNARKTICFDLQPVTHEYLKWSKWSSPEKNAYNEWLFRLQQRGIGVPRLVYWYLFYDYGCEDRLRNLMKMVYMHDYGDSFTDYS